MTRKPQIKRCGGAATTIFLVLIVAPKLFIEPGAKGFFSFRAFEPLAVRGNIPAPEAKAEDSPFEGRCTDVSL